MKVGLITKYPPYLSGPSVYAHSLTHLFTEMGHEVHVITYPEYTSGGRIDGGRTPDDFQVSGSYHHYIQLKAGGHTKLVQPPIAMMLASKAIQVGKQYELDIIESQQVLPHGFAAVTAATALDIPCITTGQGSDVNQFALDPELNGAFRFVAKQVDQLIAVSNPIKKNMIRAGASAEKISVLPNSARIGRYKNVDKNAIEKLRCKHKLQGKYIVGYVGRVFKEKGLYYLVQAAEKILKRYGNTVFVVIGDGNYVAPMKEMLVQKGLTSSFIFTGGIYEELPVYFNMMDVFAHPSLSDDSFTEGLPFSLTEASAAGVPSVTTATGGIPSLIKHNKNGVIIPQRDTKALSDSVCKLLDNPSLRKKLGKEGQKTVEQNFNMRTNAKTLISLYTELIHKKAEKTAKSTSLISSLLSFSESIPAFRKLHIRD